MLCLWSEKTFLNVKNELRPVTVDAPKDDASWQGSAQSTKKSIAKLTFCRESCMYCNVLKLLKISWMWCVCFLGGLLLRPARNVMFPKTKCRLVVVSVFSSQASSPEVFVGPTNWVILCRGGIPMQVELFDVKCAKIKVIETAELTIFFPQQIHIQPSSQQF